MDDKLTAKTAKFTSLENLYVYGITIPGTEYFLVMLFKCYHSPLLYNTYTARQVLNIYVEGILDTNVYTCHTKIGPPKIGHPGPLLAAKIGPPDRFWQPRSVPPLPKIVPQGGPNLANICLPKSVPQTESLYPANGCALIMYTRLSSSYS